MRQIVIPDRRLILPPRFDEVAYERYRIERVPFQRRRREGASVVGSPFHTVEGIGSGISANTGITCLANDCIIIAAMTNVTQPSAAAVTGATATMARQAVVTSNDTGGNTGIFTGLATVGGTISGSVIAAGATDLEWQCVVIRGISSATAHKSGTVAPSANAATYTTSFTTTVTCSFIIAWGNESTDCFTGFTPSGFTLMNHDTSHFDACGYKLGVTAAGYTPGITSNSTGGTSSTVAVIALQESGGTTFTAVERRSVGPRVGSRSNY